jgi:hypothetical protein
VQSPDRKPLGRRRRTRFRQRAGRAKRVYLSYSSLKSKRKCRNSSSPARIVKEGCAVAIGFCLTRLSPVAENPLRSLQCRRALVKGNLRIEMGGQNMRVALLACVFSLLLIPSVVPAEPERFCAPDACVKAHDQLVHLLARDATRETPLATTNVGCDMKAGFGFAAGSSKCRIPSWC